MLSISHPIENSVICWYIRYEADHPKPCISSENHAGVLPAARLCKYRVWAVPWESGGLGTNGLIFPPDLNSKLPAGAVLMPAALLNVEP